MIKVLIVDDDPMAQKFLETFVEKNEMYEHVGSIASAGIAETYCMKHQVDLILMDVCPQRGFTFISD
jgi:response regulator of citrate/malate metabolism